MKPLLMYKDRDFALELELPPDAETLTQDLELNTLFNAMALGDDFIFEVAKKAVLNGLRDDTATILYRQAVLKDCLKNASVIRELYQLALEAIQLRKGSWLGISKYPSVILYDARKMLELYAGALRKLRNIADARAAEFGSEGFTTFFAMLKKELADDFFSGVQEHLRRLEFRDGILCSAELGTGNVSGNYTLLKLEEKNLTWLERALTEIKDWLRELFEKGAPGLSFYISDRDESGSRMLSELTDRELNPVADALARSADHIQSFFTLLRAELAFYAGCANLHSQLIRLGEPACFPLPAAGVRGPSCEGLYDVCLALTMKQKVVGNDAEFGGRNPVIITGANQGGKSTFLRSIGLAQLMMQCGMFAPARSFSAGLCGGLFTHYKRKEDAAMNSGKLDEELARMSGIADRITPDSLLLLNESFAATNEREGSEIARQIITALAERGIRVFFVTHLYEFAHGLYEKKPENAIFLRAERQAGGKRTFKVKESEPLQTSYGEDLYEQIFGKTGA